MKDPDKTPEASPSDSSNNLLVKINTAAWVVLIGLTTVFSFGAAANAILTYNGYPYFMD